MSLAKAERAEHLPDLFPEVADTSAALDLAVVSDVAALEANWRDLEPRAVGSPFQRFDFYDAWLRHLGPFSGAAPLVVVGRRGALTMMILPLVARRIGPFRIAEFAGGSHANLNVGLFDRRIWPSLGAPLFRSVRNAVAEARRDIDLLRLAYQPAGIDGHPNPLVDGTSRPSPHRSFDVSLDGGFDAVLQRHNGSKKRKRIRAHERGFADVGGCRLERAATAGEALEVVHAFLAQKAVRLAAQGLPDVFALPGTLPFLEDLVRRQFARPDLDLIDCYALRHDAGVAATVIGLPFAGRQHFVMNSFEDDDHARHSPGEVALFHMIEDAARRGLDTFDFGIGDARYKRSWCDREIVMMDTLAPLTAKGAVAAGAWTLGDRAKAAIRANPRLHRLAQRLRRGVSAGSETEAAADD